MVQLEGRKAEHEALCASYRTRIQELWERLQTPAEERESLSEHMSTCRKRNREAVSPHELVFIFHPAN